MSEFDFRPTRSTRFRTARSPGFRSVPGDTGGNIPDPPVPLSLAPAPAGPLGNVFAEGFDDSLDLDSGPGGPGGPSGSPAVTSAAPEEFGKGEPSFGLDFDFEEALAGAARGAGKGFVGTLGNPIGAGIGAATGFLGQGFTLTGENIGLEEAAQPSPDIQGGLATGTLVGTDPQGIEISRAGTGVASSGDTAVGVGGVTEAEAQDLSGVSSDPDPGGFAADAEAEAGDPGGVGGGEGTESDDTGPGGDGGDAGGGGGDGGGDDEGGDDPERAGGPVVATRPGGTVPRTAHDGEFVLQAGPTQALGQDALNLMNSGRFDAARVRRALGMAAQPGASFSGPSRPQTALATVRG